MQKQVLLTDEGLRKLEDELDFLKTVRRKEIAEKIKVALSFGDLSENSEYDEAKNEQAMVESRIVTIEAMLKNVKLIDENEINTEIIHVGSRAKVKTCRATGKAPIKLLVLMRQIRWKGVFLTSPLSAKRFWEKSQGIRSQ